MAGAVLAWARAVGEFGATIMFAGNLPRETQTLPLAAPGLMAGAVLAWARAVGEFGATIMFAGNLPRETQTLPLAIYGRYEAGDLETSLAMALILLVSSFLVLVSVRGLGGRLRLSAAD
jgi:molybdate transport system permease protein